MEALRVCEAKDRDFLSVFRRQYFLSETPRLSPKGWKARKLGHWNLYHCPDLQVADLKDSAGKKVGFFLGIGVGRDGEIFPGKTAFAKKAAAAAFWETVCTEIEGVAGRYVAIVSDGRDTRVFFDPVCDMSAVYDPVGRVVASSLLLCLHRPMQVNRRVDKRGPLRLTHNFALQHTADRFVKRAMANHYLDLKTFCMVRHFPRGDEDFEHPETDLESCMEQIVARLQQIMAVLLENYSCLIPVTGGNDSRNLIACCGPHLDKAGGLFTYHMNKMSGFDCILAQQIGDVLGQQVDMIDVTTPEHAHLFDKQRLHAKRWDIAFATGYNWPGSSPETIVAGELAPDGDILIRGNVMELMRANQYEPGKWNNFSIEHALGKLRVAPEITETQVAIWGPEYLMWADTLPQNAKNRVYDFAFAELLLPNTMGGTLIAPTPQFYMNAFSDRTMMSLAMSMPPRIRRGNKLNRMLVDLACPALNGIERTNKFRKNPDNHQLYQAKFGDAS